jgi:hypothetical protein
MKVNKEKRFEFLLTEQELTDLRNLAARKGVSQGSFLRGFIRRSAQRIQRDKGK